MQNGTKLHHVYVGQGQKRYCKFHHASRCKCIIKGILSHFCTLFHRVHVCDCFHWLSFSNQIKHFRTPAATSTVYSSTPPPTAVFGEHGTCTYVGPSLCNNDTAVLQKDMPNHAHYNMEKLNICLHKETDILSQIFKVVSMWWIFYVTYHSNLPSTCKHTD